MATSRLIVSEDAIAQADKDDFAKCVNVEMTKSDLLLIRHSAHLRGLKTIISSTRFVIQTVSLAVLYRNHYAGLHARRSVA